MEDLAMLRKFLPLLLLLAPTISKAEDLAKLLEARYHALNNAIVRRDGKAAEQWVAKYCAPNFLYTSKDKHRWDRKGFRQGLLDQIKLTQKVEKSTVKLGKPKVDGKRATITFRNDFQAMVSYDGRALTVTDKTETEDVWVKAGSDWKLVKVTQTVADTQLYQRK